MTVDGQEVKFSPIEFTILQMLVAHPGKVLTHRQIMEEVWGGSTDIQYLRTYMRNLRRKLGVEPNGQSCIGTESGVGYRLVGPEY